jgi:hypothetical protein
MAAGAAILDLGVTSISNLDFYSVSKFLTHENIGLETEIESLTSLLFMLLPIYRYLIMAAGGHFEF